MKKNLSLILLVGLISCSVFSQKKKDVLLTIDDTAVSVSEFKRIYKKNLDLVQDESQKDVDGYLELFIDYKLKVREAYNQNLNKNEAYVKEFSKYQEQLSRNYIFEDKVTEDLVQEAYQRGLEEIDATHVLILTTWDDVPQDTLAAYKKIQMVLEKAKKGENFTELVNKYSEEPGASERGGKLGYFTVFSMVYPFETVAYNTPVGGISEITRTQFGYHVLKINDRRKKEAKISVSHIMTSIKNKSNTSNPKERIDELHAMLEQGAEFENIAKQFSDDKNTAIKGGKMRAFSRGDLKAPSFENAAYDLQKPGDYSKPIETSFGWHIVRLEQKFPLPTFDEMEKDLVKRVETNDRAKIVTQEVNKKIEDKYGMTENDNTIDFFNTFIGDEVLKRKWEFNGLSEGKDEALLTIGDRTISYSQFAKYILERQTKSRPYKNKKVMLIDYLDEFRTQEIRQYFKDRLELENEEYATVIEEYRNGLLIFDIMNNNIWEKAKNDSIGIQKFHETVRANYVWKERVNAIVVSTSNKEVSEKAQKLLASGISPEAIKKEINDDGKVLAILSEGVFELGRRELPEGFVAKKGVSEIYTKDDTHIVVKVSEVIAPTEKELDEVKGKVMSDYQNYLEKEWMTMLRQKFKVEVNKKALKKIKKEFS